MKVLHCIYDHPSNPWVGGGGAVRLVEIYRRLAGEVDLTLLAGRFPGADALSDGSWQFTGVPRPYALSRLTYGAAATRRLRTDAYDAAVFDFSAYTPIRVPRHRPVGMMLGQLASPTSGTRWGRAAPLLQAWERSQLSSARHVCAVSAWLLESARPFLRPDATTTVVGAGVDEGYFAVARAEDDYVLYYGRFDVFQKGIDLLLDAFARLRSVRPRLRLKMAGRGRDAARIAAMVRERGLFGAVEIIRDPAPDRTHALMAGAAVQAMPSRFEGFGMVAAEAMAAGVPLVASGVDAVPDVVGADGAVLVPGENAGALADAIARLLDSPAERAALSTAARLRARRYSWDQVAREHLAWLQRIAADRL
jgi:glycosyltransferase involved in cell wall biosynthesis